MTQWQCGGEDQCTCHDRGNGSANWPWEWRYLYWSHQKTHGDGAIPNAHATIAAITLQTMIQLDCKKMQF